MDMDRFKDVKDWEKLKELGQKELTDNEKKDLANFMNKAQGMQEKGEAESLKELTQMVKSSKASGGVSDEQLNHFADALTPMLDEGQKQRLAQIMRMLKE